MTILTMRIGCLHTANSNIPVFDAALASLACADVRLSHQVRPDLLAAAVAAGGLNDEIVLQTSEALAALCAVNEVVLLTCSTLGPVVSAFVSSTPVLRVDEALARQAVTMSTSVVALCAVETTLAPTRALFEQRARETGATVDVRLVDDAWGYFMAGEMARYDLTMAQAADSAYAEGAGVVAFAQASMAGAAAYVRHNRSALTSPISGLQAAIAACRNQSD
ncbi:MULTISPECIES: hypothetical protein [unclassified Paludibacterium]|uniref:hypothetical protein n=1 Tax=unclassified Paludibacterium TaxID=2618429 RepID=UPI001C053836|nr:hypothetical protein [Paludibacterium sp. B53371]BEV70824.1 aspartate/glutamate racemase family protein [Paludibacterium sp. THUN1379]